MIYYKGEYTDVSFSTNYDRTWGVTELKKFFAAFVSVTMLIAVMLPASVFAASQAPSLTDVCTFKVDKQRIYVSDDSSKKTATIEAACDTSKISLLDIHAESSNPSVGTVEQSNSSYSVKSVSDGSFSVKLSADGYTAFQMDFAVGDAAPLGNADLPAVDPDDSSAADDTGPVAAIDPRVEKAINELQAYADQLTPFAKYEEAAVNTYAKYRLVTPKTRKQAYLAFNNVIIPNYTKFVYFLKNVKTTNTYLAAMNADYIKGAKLQLEGFNLMKASLSKASIDQKMYKAANVKLNAGYKLIAKFSTDFENYALKLQKMALE